MAEGVLLLALKEKLSSHENEKGENQHNTDGFGCICTFPYEN